MRTIKAVFDYTLKETLRRRIWVSAALFGLILVGGGVTASVLAAEERARMMLDLGLAANEAIGLLLMAYLAAHLILSEIDSRGVYLILTRPVRRWEYLLGRFLGTLAAVALGMAGLGLVHWALLAALGWGGGGSYLLAWSCSLARVAVTGSLALLLSLALTSEEAALAFTGFLWIMGHFSGELRFIADKSGSAPLRAGILFFSRAAPDFARLNYRDAWHAGLPHAGWAFWAGLYALGYCAACLALAVQLFEQKEF
jgi:hypothetical protein